MIGSVTGGDRLPGGDNNASLLCARRRRCPSPAGQAPNAANIIFKERFDEWEQLGPVKVLQTTTSFQVGRDVDWRGVGFYTKLGFPGTGIGTGPLQDRLQIIAHLI